MTESCYAFRDTADAAGRLGFLGEVFEPASAGFVQELAPPEPGLAYDLGCGPGLTTRMVRELSGARRAVGLDESDNFVSLARDNFPDLEFAVHDVTQPGFPAGAADLIYSRMLLTHLRAPRAALDVWAGELATGGVLLVDEVEAIETAEPVFTEYLQRVAALIGGRGGELYIGRELDSITPAGLRRVESRVTHLSPDPRAAAGLFRMNLAVWGPEHGELDKALYRVVSAGAAPITWMMRQIAYARG